MSLVANDLSVLSEKLTVDLHLVLIRPVNIATTKQYYKHLRPEVKTNHISVSPNK